jgi:hypothetical protein
MVNGHSLTKEAYADFVRPRGLIPICADRKACYVGIFGCEAFEIMREERKKKQRENDNVKRMEFQTLHNCKSQNLKI